jgi:hypothetical protein
MTDLQLSKIKKMSRLIKIALADLAKVERSKKYVVDMYVWHRPIDADGVRCAVCFAGSVMATSLKAALISYFAPADFISSRQLYALNYLRHGYVRSAARVLEVDKDNAAPFIRYVTPYADSPTQFKKDMRKLAKDLEKAGL